MKGRRHPAARVGFAFLLLCFSAAACRTPRVDLPMRMGPPLAVDDARAQRVFDAYLARAAARSGLRGAARVALVGRDFKLNRPQRIVAERPARLRFEVVGLFEQLAAVLTTDGREFGFYDAATGEISRGRLTPSLLWELARIDLSAEELVGLLLATPTPSPGIARAAVWREEPDRLALAFGWSASPARGCARDPRRGWADAACFATPAALAAGAEIFVFDALGRLVELRVFEEDGVLRMRARFEEYADVAAPDSTPAGQPAESVAVASAADGFPNRMTIESPEVAAEARFRWTRVMLAEELSDRWFRIPERRGVPAGG